MNMTHTTVTIAMAFMDDPKRQRYGLDLARQTRLASGALYPALRRMFHAGWLAEHREEVLGSQVGRPPRCYYTVTAQGRTEMAAMIERARREQRWGGLAY